MSTTPHWTAEQFRRAAHEAVDVIADYWSRLQQPEQPWPVLSKREPGATAAMLPTHAPELPQAWPEFAADLERIVLPGLTHWQSPRFFGYFPANVSPPAVVAEMLAAGLGVQGMLWSTSPACTEIETRMLDWMARAIELPERFWSPGADCGTEARGASAVNPARKGGGVIQGTASEAALVAMLAARQRVRVASAAAGSGAQPERLCHGDLIAYTSTQAHSSIVKAAMICGVSRDATAREGLVGGPGSGVRLIATDGGLRMNPAALDAAISADRAAGATPFFVCATLGTTASMAVDDLAAIGEVCRRQGVWLHVDAAYAGSACICPEHRTMLRGIECADSFCFNPHKWLLTNFDCSLFWTADREAIVSAMSITPEYLRNAASDAGRVWDYRDWQVPLGRRFRALKLWLVLRSYGLEGLRGYIREHVRLAAVFADLVRSDARFEIPVEPGLGLVCFRLRAGDEASRALLARVNASGRVFLSHATLPVSGQGGKAAAPIYVLRMAIGGTFTREEHVREAWGVIRGEGLRAED